MPKVNDQVNVGTEHHGVQSVGTKPTSELSADPPGLDAFARTIVKRISDAAIELAFVRHGLTSDEYIEDEELGLDEGVESWKGFVEDIKSDTINCLTGDDFGCLDPEDLDEDNCELIWLKAQLTNGTA